MWTLPFCSKTILIVFTFLIAATVSYGAANTVKITGFGECADCQQNNIKHSHALKGLKVTINCLVANGEVKTRATGELDRKGKFQVDFPKEFVEDGKLKEECYAQLHCASNAPCPVYNGIESSKISSLFETSDGKHTFRPIGKLKFSSATCTSAFLWPIIVPKIPLKKHFIFPPIWKKPIVPCFPMFKKPCLPFVPIYKKPPPPHVPLYHKSMPPPLPVPVYKPPTVPVYPKPIPPTVPAYKPPTVPVPVYKPPTVPVPAYKPPIVPVNPKPLPPTVPVYKPPTVPVYPKPIPPTVPIYKKPCPTKPITLPPLPKIPPFFPKKPCPPLFPKLPFPKFPPHPLFKKPSWPTYPSHH